MEQQLYIYKLVVLIDIPRSKKGTRRVTEEYVLHTSIPEMLAERFRHGPRDPEVIEHIINVGPLMNSASQVRMWNERFVKEEEEFYSDNPGAKGTPLPGGVWYNRAIVDKYSRGVIMRAGQVESTISQEAADEMAVEVGKQVGYIPPNIEIEFLPTE